MATMTLIRTRTALSMEVRRTVDSEAKERSQPTSLSIVEIYKGLRDPREVVSPDTETKLLEKAASFDKHFPLIDRDRNGFISATELNSSLEDRSLNKNSVHFVMSARSTFERLQKIHDDAGATGISKHDLAAMVNAQRSYHALRQEGIDKIFARIDTNGDGKWSSAEIEAAASDPKQTFGIRSLMKEVARSKDRIYEGTYVEGKSELTAASIKQRYSDWLPMAVAIENGLVHDFSAAGSPASNAEGDVLPLYTNTSNPAASIVSEAVLQPDVAGGNCQFVATLKSLAQVNKAAIAKMIRDNGNDTYTVTFPGAPDTPITVSRPVDMDLFTGRRPNDCVWPYVLQKAYGRLRDQNATNDFSGARNGSEQAYSYRVLIPSNRCSLEDLPAKSHKELADKIQRTIQSGLPVVAGTPSERRTSFVKRHGYAVLSIDVDEAVPGNSKVTLQSTFGARDSAEGFKDLGDGTYQLSLYEMDKNFAGLILGEPARARHTIYNWTDLNPIERSPVAEALLVGLGAGASLTGAALFRRSGAIALGAFSANELVRDGLVAFRTENKDDRFKYGLATAADGVMLVGSSSRLLRSTKGYGLAIAGGAFAARWAIEKFL